MFGVALRECAGCLFGCLFVLICFVCPFVIVCECSIVHILEMCFQNGMCVNILVSISLSICLCVCLHDLIYLNLESDLYIFIHVYFHLHIENVKSKNKLRDCLNVKGDDAMKRKNPGNAGLRMRER